MGIWTHIIIEGYCFFEHLSEKKHIYYKVIDIKKFKTGKKRIEINKNYISPKERPKWCISQNKKRKPLFRCLCYGKNDKRCPFFSMVNANRPDYYYLNKKYSKI